MNNSQHMLSLFNIRRLLIFLYGLSTCFGTFAIAGDSRNFTMSFILAMLYMLSMVISINSIGSTIRKYAQYITPIFLLIALITIMNVFNANGYNVPMIPIPMLSCFILFLAMLLHSLFDSKAIEYCILGFAVGSMVLATLFILGIGIYVEDGILLDEDERMSMFGQNQNELGLIMAHGIALVLMFVIKDELHLGTARYLLTIPVVFMLSLLLSSASRAAFVSLVLIAVLIVLLHKANGCLSQITFWLISIGLCIWGLSHLDASEIMYERIMMTLEEGNSSGRGDIWSALMPRLLETPILGVGQTGYADVAHKELSGISRVMHEYGYSPHNVFIEVFAYSGIVGLCLILTFWIRITRDSVNIYKNMGNILPMLLLVPILLSILTGQVLANKFAWVVYAYIVILNSNYKQTLCIK